MMSNRFVFADRQAPLDARIRPTADYLKTLLCCSSTTGRYGKTTCIESHQCDLQSLTFHANQVLSRNAYIAEAYHTVCQRPETHEATAVFYLHAFPTCLNNKGTDLFCLWIASHHHQQFSQCAVCTP